MIKKNWTKSWKASIKPRKQHTYVRNAPRHMLGDFVASHLSKDLREKHKIRSLRLRVGDKVKILRGSFKNKTGKVERMNVQRRKVYITGIELTKRDGAQAEAAAALPDLRQDEAAAAAALQRLLIDRDNLDREEAQVAAAQELQYFSGFK